MSSIRLLPFLLLLLTSLSSPASSSRNVSLALYYESLCPYCANFIVNHLPNIFHNGLISAVDLHLIPYGNAKLNPNSTTISCQHGPFECLLNTIEACAISVWPDLHDHFNFIYCVESLIMEGKYMKWESCFQQTGLNSKAVVDCYNSGYGHKLELQYAEQTDSLQPPHKYVPWVVVDGQPLYEDYEDFEGYICKAYEGAPPKACEKLSLVTTPEMKRNRADRVCHANEVISSTES